MPFNNDKRFIFGEFWGPAEPNSLHKSWVEKIGVLIKTMSNSNSNHVLHLCTLCTILHNKAKAKS